MEKYRSDNLIDKIDAKIQKLETNDFQKKLLTQKLKPVHKSLVGFSKIASQIHRDSIIRGFQLNLMLVGCTGLGKSTFLNNLFRTQFPGSNQNEAVTETPLFLMDENDVRLQLKVIEVPDFGKKINNSDCWKSVDNYLQQCFLKRLQEEEKTNRRTGRVLNDNLVHVCLYFVQPNSEDRCLRQIDLEFLKNAHEKINLVPLIAKADSMTEEEIRIHKTNLANELHENQINYFQFKIPKDSGWRAHTGNTRYPDRRLVQTLIDRFPFAVAAGNQTMMVDNNQVTVRSYPWGFIQIDDLNHCDTSAVRTLLLSTHLQELITETETTIYENYRYRFFEKSCLKLGISHQNQFHPMLYLDLYFKKVHSALERKVEEMEKGFQDLADRKMEALERKRVDIDNESMEMTKEINYLYSKLDQEISYFLAERTKWDNENSGYNESCVALKVKKHGLLSVLSKFGR